MSAMRGLIALVPLLLAVPAAAQDAPPPVPGSYELRRLETQLQVLAAQQRAEARRQSRQRENTGNGAAAGAESPLSLSMSPELAVRGGIAAILGLAAIAAVSNDASPLLEVGGGGGPATRLAGVATATR